MFLGGWRGKTRDTHINQNHDFLVVEMCLALKTAIFPAPRRVADVNLTKEDWWDKLVVDDFERPNHMVFIASHF